MLKRGSGTSSKEAFKTTASSLSSDPTNATYLGGGTSFDSFLKQEPTFLGRYLLTADLPLPTLVQLTSCGRGEAWKANHTGRCYLEVKVSCCCLCHWNCCHATPQKGLRIRDGNKQWGGVWWWLRCGCIYVCMKGIQSCVICDWLKIRHIFCVIQEGSLWALYAHCSSCQCFIILNIFVQCEDPDQWWPKIQNYHNFFKGKYIYAVTYIHYELQMPIISQGNLKEKCQTFC